jgi:hypothetical protein
MTVVVVIFPPLVLAYQAWSTGRVIGRRGPSDFPGISAVNPELTGMANAIRVGDRILARLGQVNPAGLLSPARPWGRRA